MSIGVVVIAHNVEPWIGCAIQSVADQQRPADAVVVVENGSSDNTIVEIDRALTSISEAELVVLSRPAPMGSGAARNLGLEYLHRLGIGQVAFLDGDDWWTSSALEHFERGLTRDNAIATFGATLIRNSSGRLRGLRMRFKTRYSYKDLLRWRSPMLTTSSMAADLEAVQQVRGFRNLRAGDDWDLALSLTRAGGVMTHLRRFTTNYRRRGGSKTKSLAGLIEGTSRILDTHPGADRALHWWSLLQMAEVTGDRESRERILQRRAPLRLSDLFCAQFLRYSFYRFLATVR